MRRTLFWLSLAALMPSASILAASQPAALKAPENTLSTVIHPRLSAWAAVSPEPRRIWIRFTDHGSATGHQVPLSERAIQRRLLRGVSLDTPERQPVAPEYLTAVQRTGAQIHRVSRWLNAVSVAYDAELVSHLASLPFVQAIQPVARFRRPDTPQPMHADLAKEGRGASGSSLNYGPSGAQIIQIGANLAHDRGYSGQDVLVAMFDTGFRKDHQTFATAIAGGRLLGEYDFVFDDGEVQNEAADHPSAHNHGTMAWSVLGGTTPGQLYGTAYGASFLLAKTEDIRSETPVEEDNWMAAVEWADSLGTDVISSSLSYSDWYTASDYDGVTAVTSQAANLAATLGIVVCNSAGNAGPGASTIGAPADALHLLSVGSVTSTGSISNFSSRGPTFDGRIKPEVLARGSSTSLALPTSTTSYGTGSGTSFSCPLVGGCAALIIEAHPTWNPLMVREALMQTGDHAGAPDNTYGWGIVDVNAAIDYTGSVTVTSAVPPPVWISYAPELNVAAVASSLSPVDMAGTSLYVRTDSAGYVAHTLIQSGDTLHTSLAAPTAPAAVIDYYFVVKDSVGFVSRLPENLDSTYTLTWQTIMPGDLNKDLIITSADVIELVGYVFRSGPAPDPLAQGEINGSPPINAADIVYLVNYLFKSGPPPVFP